MDVVDVLDRTPTTLYRYKNTTGCNVQGIRRERVGYKLPGHPLRSKKSTISWTTDTQRVCSHTYLNISESTAIRLFATIQSENWNGVWRRQRNLLFIVANDILSEPYFSNSQSIIIIMFVKNKRAQPIMSLSSSNTKIAIKRGAFPVAAEGSFPAQYDNEPEVDQQITKQAYYGNRGLKRLCCFVSDDRATVYPSTTLAKQRRYKVPDDSCAPLLDAVDSH